MRTRSIVDNLEPAEREQIASLRWGAVTFGHSALRSCDLPSGHSDRTLSDAPSAIGERSWTRRRTLVTSRLRRTVATSRQLVALAAAGEADAGARPQPPPSPARGR